MNRVFAGLTFGCILLSLIACTNRKVIKIKGSDTEVNLVVNLAEAFHEIDPDFKVSISGGGSGLGIASLMNGLADLANSSRPLKDYEYEIFAKRDIQVDSFIFAYDAIAFIVNREMHLDSLSIDDLRNILSGRISNWAAVKGSDMPINIYGRQNNSGTYTYIQTKLGIQFTNKSNEMNGNAQIMEAVKSDPSGIGYVGAGYVKGGGPSINRKIKVLHISAPDKPAYSPLDTHAVHNELYFFQRPLYQFMQAGNRARLKPFLDFELSPKGQELITKEGYYPVKNE